MTRTYESITYSQIKVKIKVNGEFRHIAFTGALTGQVKRNGRFTTSNPAIIEAMEKDGSFNRLYKLIGSSGEPVKKKEIVKKVDPPVDTPEKIDPDESNTDQVPASNTEKITHLMTLKAHLVKEFGASADEVKNKKDILAKATELGVDISGIK